MKTGPHSGFVKANGAIAQLGERLHGMQEVSGSIPLGSTTPGFAGGMNRVSCCKLVGEVSPTGFFRVSEESAHV